MGPFITHDYLGEPFHLFGTIHLLTIGLIILLSILIYVFRDRFTDRGRYVFRYGVAIVVILNEIFWHIWNIIGGTWNIQKLLPLWVCSVLIWLIPFLLISKNRFLFDFYYFMGIIGAVQAIATPDIGIYGFPHSRYFQFFIGHGGLLLAVFYMTWVEGFRPTWKSVWRVLIGMNIYWGFTAIVNALIGSNYLYTGGKLETASMLDVLGPYPWYLLSMEVLGWILIIALYLPYAIRDKKEAQMQAESAKTIA